MRTKVNKLTASGISHHARIDQNGISSYGLMIFETSSTWWSKALCRHYCSPEMVAGSSASPFVHVNMIGGQLPLTLIRHLLLLLLQL